MDGFDLGNFIGHRLLALAGHVAAGAGGLLLAWLVAVWQRRQRPGALALEILAALDDPAARIEGTGKWLLAGGLYVRPRDRKDTSLDPEIRTATGNRCDQHLSLRDLRRVDRKALARIAALRAAADAQARKMRLSEVIEGRLNVKPCHTWIAMQCGIPPQSPPESCPADVDFDDNGPCCDGSDDVGDGRGCTRTSQDQNPIDRQAGGSWRCKQPEAD